MSRRADGPDGQCVGLVERVELELDGLDGATGYNLYRSTTSGNEGTTPINSSPITTTTYSDYGRAAGTTYYYKVAAINGSGVGPQTSGDASATTSAAITAPSNLVGYWRLDENTGTTAYDSATAGSTADNGTFSTGHVPTWATGKIGNAVAFNGVSEYVTINSSADLQITSAITVACWAKASSNGNWTTIDSFVSKNNSYSLGGVNTSKNVRFGV